MGPEVRRSTSAGTSATCGSPTPPTAGKTTGVTSSTRSKKRGNGEEGKRRKGKTTKQNLFPFPFCPFTPFPIKVMSWYYFVKKFYDYADDIEGVNIHYVWTPLGSVKAPRPPSYSRLC